MSSTKAQVTFISETRTSKITSSQLNSRFDSANSFVVPSEGLSRGLWILWTEDVEVEVKFFNHHVILAIVVDIASKIDFVLACVYGDPHHCLTSVIWNHISTFIHDNPGKPVVCIGDLNDIMYESETTSTSVKKYRIRAFNDLVKQCGLLDLGFSGPAYTWTNKRFSSVPMFERLDRCLANAEWCGYFPNTNVYNLPIMFDDHAPILLSTDSQFRRPKLKFKFENWWSLEPDYQQTAKAAWALSARKPFYVRTNKLAGTLKVWCKKKKPLQQLLDELQVKINEIQMQPPQLQDHALEASLISQYEQSITKLTEAYRQRAKKHWSTQGDRNTAYFHNAVQKRRRRNRIASINDTFRNTLIDPNDIANEFSPILEAYFVLPLLTTMKQVHA